MVITCPHPLSVDTIPCNNRRLLLVAGISHHSFVPFVVLAVCIACFVFLQSIVLINYSCFMLLFSFAINNITSYFHTETEVPTTRVISIPSMHFWIAAGCLAVFVVFLLFLVSVLIRKKQSAPLYETPLDITSPQQDSRQRVTLRGTNNRRSNPPQSPPISEANITPLNSGPGPSGAGIYTSLLPPRDYKDKDRRSNTPDYVNISAGEPRPRATKCADYEEPSLFFSFGRRKGPRLPKKNRGGEGGRVHVL